MQLFSKPILTNKYTTIFNFFTECSDGIAIVFTNPVILYHN